MKGQMAEINKVTIPFVQKAHFTRTEKPMSLAQSRAFF
jgi:hypothetical protein